jgi:hypothetical protein
MMVAVFTVKPPYGLGSRTLPGDQAEPHSELTALTSQRVFEPQWIQTRSVKIFNRTISWILTASPLTAPGLEFQPDIPHTEDQTKPRGTSGIRYELENITGIRLRVA